MRKNLIELLLFLLEKDTRVAGKEISNHFDVTLRTIQNYIREINIMYPSLIDSNAFGYQILTKNKAYDVVNHFNSFTHLPQNNEERGIFIIKRILISKKKRLKVYDIIDLLHISLSTFNNTVSSARDYLKTYNLKMIRENNTLKIEGEESNKRKLISDIIYEESSRNMLLTEELDQYFGEDIQNTAIALISHLSEIEGYSINDYVYQNLILHICILLFRVQEGNRTNLYKNYLLKDKDIVLLDSLLSIIKNKLQIELETFDQIELVLLIKTKLNFKVAIDDKSIIELIDEEHFEIVEKIIVDINRIYNVNLNTDAFRIPFSLHLQNLIFRMKNDNLLKNASASSIRESYPLIYDISAHVAILIQDFTGCQIIEDEIAFIALHIGAELERQKETENKIKTIFIIQEYLDIQTRLFQEMEKHFQNELSIISVNSSIENVSNWEGIDLIVSTIAYDKTQLQLSSVNYVHIPAFNQKEAKYLIFEAINEIEYSKKLSILFENFDRFFNNNLFIIDESLDNPKIIIETLGDKLLEHKYVTKEFSKFVLEREGLASTAFGSVAIPHQFIEPSLKSGIVVLLNKDGIKWGNNTVKIVLLVSITSKDKALFKNLYEALLSFFTIEEYVKTLSNTNSFIEFKEEILKRIPNL